MAGEIATTSGESTNPVTARNLLVRTPPAERRRPVRRWRRPPMSVGTVSSSSLATACSAASDVCVRQCPRACRAGRVHRTVHSRLWRVETCAARAGPVQKRDVSCSPQTGSGSPPCPGWSIAHGDGRSSRSVPQPCSADTAGLSPGSGTTPPVNLLGGHQPLLRSRRSWCGLPENPRRDIDAFKENWPGSVTGLPLQPSGRSSTRQAWARRAS